MKFSFMTFLLGVFIGAFFLHLFNEEFENDGSGNKGLFSRSDNRDDEKS